MEKSPSASASEMNMSVHVFFFRVDVMVSQLNLSNIQKFFSRVWFALRSSTLGLSTYSWSLDDEFSRSVQQQSFCAVDDGGICRGEAEMVMGRLGIFCNPGGEELKDRLSSNEFVGLFDEEPSLDEVKQAFNVFDENKDGFIDASELQRVLCILGLSEGSSIENCKKMIKRFDKNADGRIDFNEFVKFMENSFC